MVSQRKWDFYAVQKAQWFKSLFVFIALLIFYVLAVGFISWALLLSMGLFIPGLFSSIPDFLTQLILGSFLLALLIAAFHYYDAKAHGARFIRKRLQARTPDPSDRYHIQFANAVEEMRIAAGLPRVKPYVLPTFAVNSMALMESTGRPSVLVTEGLLAEFTRDEVEAVIAHELAHISRGDTIYITLVCSLGNFFERLKLAVEPERDPSGFPINSEQSRNTPFLFYIALALSLPVMRLLSTLISRQREILADAAGVEFCRNPRALARAIYRAHVQNSFIGDFSLTYSPLLIVPPYSEGQKDTFLNRIFSSHPPLMKRIQNLAEMVSTSANEIIEEIQEIRKARKKAQTTLTPHQTIKQEKSKPLSAADMDQSAERVWGIHRKKGEWIGPLSLKELIFHNYFTPRVQIINAQENMEAPALPRCRIPLITKFYEGVPTQSCRKCGGRLIKGPHVDRIIARREVTFSQALLEQAKEFKDRYMENPFHTVRINLAKTSTPACPDCGTKMIPRPYTYQYVVPVDKCLSCQNVWFDTNELEILQILIENRESISL